MGYIREARRRAEEQLYSQGSRPPGKYELLESKDEIYFLDDAGNGIALTAGDKRYMCARVARFVEDKQ